MGSKAILRDSWWWLWGGDQFDCALPYKPLVQTSSRNHWKIQHWAQFDICNGWKLLLSWQVHPQDLTYWPSWDTTADGTLKLKLWDSNYNSNHLCQWVPPEANCHFQRKAASREGPVLKPFKCIICMLIPYSIPNSYVYRLQCTEKGYMNGVTGWAWIKDDFDAQTQEKANGCHCLLIVDGHTFHFDYELLQFAKANHIVVLCVIDEPNKSIRLSSREQAQYIKYLMRAS